MNFDFGKVLSRSWQIIWKHKVLWVFGILASCARGNGGGSGNSSGGNRYQTGPNGTAPFPTDQFDPGMQQFGQFLNENLWIIIAIIIAIFLLSFVLYALGMMGRIGLIKGTFKVENGAESLAFGELWSESMPYFWRVFGLNFLIVLIFIVVFIPFFLFGILTAGVGLICLIPLICIMIPISWVVLVIIEQAQAGIVLEDLGMWDGFRRGWEIVKSNVGPMVVMALILGIGGVIISLVISVPILIAVVPLIIGASTLQESLTPLWIALACCIAYMPILIFFNGMLTAYIQSAWTLTFMQLAKPKENTPILVEPNA